MMPMIIEGDVLAVTSANIDTDQIIPARFLTRIDSLGMGEHLFDGLPGGPVLLEQQPGATILVTGDNFGCGSSREHAAWAIASRGFRAVIAPGFARIFLENAYNNAIVPVTVTAGDASRLARARRIAIDLVSETLRADGAAPIEFHLDPLRKQFVIGGGFLAYLEAKIPAVRRWEERST